MGAEQGFAILLKMLLTCFKQSVDPWKEFFGCMVGMKDHRNAISLCHGMDVFGSADGTNNGRFLIFVGKSFSGKEYGTSVGELNDDWCVCNLRRLECGVDGIRANNV